jgi:hypothetical protein
MNMNKIIKQLATLALGALGAVGCAEAPFDYARGSLPPMDGERAIPTVTLRSRSTPAKVGNSPFSALRMRIMNAVTYDDIYITLDRTTDEVVSIKVLPADQSIVDAWNVVNSPRWPYEMCSADAISFPDGDVLTVQPGEVRSNTIRVAINKDSFTQHNAVMALNYTELAGTVKKTPSTLYYFIEDEYIGFTYPPREELPEDDCIVVGYVNTSNVLPEKATYICVDILDISTYENTYYRWFDIINLNTANLRSSAEDNRPVLYLNPDIGYMLEHREKYIAPVQNSGQKVCLVIKGGNTGLGFSNMTDGQIADFVFQVESVIEKYNLDGVNLWDEGAGYGKEGMPAVNTTSYPKLIKALDEAMPDKLITLADMGEPFDVAQGGITVGDHIDYAWHMELCGMIDPWEAGAKRKPILGLDRDSYGGMTVDVLTQHRIEREDQNFSDSQFEFMETGPMKVFVVADIIDHILGIEGSEVGTYGLPISNLSWFNDDWTEGEFYNMGMYQEYTVGIYEDSNWRVNW